MEYINQVIFVISWFCFALAYYFNTDNKKQYTLKNEVLFWITSIITVLLWIAFLFFCFFITYSIFLIIIYN